MVLSYTKQVLRAEHSTLPKAEVGVQVCSDILIALDGFASKVYDVANQILGFWLELLYVCS